MLSPQQQKIYNLLLTDCTMGDIARELGLDPRTVSGYSNTIYFKFGVKTRIGLVTQHYIEIINKLKNQQNTLQHRP